MGGRQRSGRNHPQQWQQPKNIDYKGAIDLVTSVDRESERRIVRHCYKTNFPGHSILAEEETDLLKLQSHYRWIIDPLDGTTNFAHGYPQFCVSIALEHDSEIIRRLGLRSAAPRVFQSGSKVKAQHSTAQPIQTSPASKN